MTRPAVFLDRDGTLTVSPPEGDYVVSPDELVLLPGVASALRRLEAAGLPRVVVTNQRAVRRGLLTVAGLDAVHDRLDALLRAEGASVDAYYACVHGDGECACRKPLPGLLLRAAAEHDLDLAASVMVGDTERDVGAGRAAGARTIRLAPPGTPTAADLVVGGLAAAVDAVLGAGDRR